MVVGKTSKITVTLPLELVELADKLAEEWSTNRSGVIVSLLEKEEKTRLRQLMIEGYQAMAAENLREAEEALNLTSEVALR